jgi:hypothetical protein
MERVEEFLSHAELEDQVNLANADWAAGRYSVAFFRYLDLATLRLRQAGRAAALTAADLVVLERLAGMATLFGHVERADSILATMTELTSAAGNVSGSRYLELHRLHLALSTGRMEAVREILATMEKRWLGPLANMVITPTGLATWERGLATPGGRPEDRTVLLIRLHFALGWSLAANGQYRDSLTCYGRAADLADANSAPPEARAVRLPLTLRRAMALLERGDLDACESVLAVLTDDVAVGSRIAQKVEWLELQLRLALLRGNFGAALDYGGEIVRTCVQGGFTRALAAARLNLAQSLLLINHTRYATELADAVLAMPDLPSSMATRARHVQALAEARVRSPIEGVPPASVTQMWRRGREVASEAGTTEPLSPLPTLPAAADFLDLFNDRATEFQWHLGQRNLVRSASILRHIEEMFAATDSLLIALRIESLRTLQCYFEDRLEDTQARIGKLLPELRARGLRPELWQTLRLAGWCAVRMGRSPQQVRQLREEADALLNALSYGLSATDRAAFLLNKWTEDEEVLASWIDRLVEARRRMMAAPLLLRPFHSLNVHRKIRALLNRVEEYRTKMAIGSGTTGSRRTAMPSFLPSDRAAIVFLTLPDRVVVVRLARSQTDFVVAPITRQDLRDRVAAWHSALLAPGSRPRHVGLSATPAAPPLAAAEETAMRLAQELGLPALLADLPARVTAISFVPDDVLHGFPFSALRWQGRAIIEDRAVSLAFTVDRTRRPVVGVGGRAVLVAVAGGAPAHGGFPAVSPLPNTKIETDELAPWFHIYFGVVDRLDDPAVDKARVLEALPGASLVHFACHGIFQPDAPHLSGLLLTPHGTHAELLSLAELSRVNFGATRHVTLSSCWSADSFVLPGRRILSLPETLWRAGADSVLASLWPVDDQASVAFMKRFHDHLSVLPRGEALRRTQCECLSGVLGARARNPYFWAGFTLYGEAGPLF